MHDAQRVASDIFDALAGEAWYAAARHIHPRVAARLYHETSERIRHWSEPEGPTLAQFRQQDPDMPEAVAEYLVARARTSRYVPTTWTDSFPGLESPEEFEAMTSLDYMARYLETFDVRAQYRARLEDDGEAAHEWTADMARGPDRVILGAVLEGDDVAHITYRVTWSREDGPGLLDHVDLLTLRKSDDGWKAVSIELNGLPKNMWFWVQVPSLPEHES